jgi:hypothetical protein
LIFDLGRRREDDTSGVGGTAVGIFVNSNRTADALAFLYHNKKSTIINRKSSIKRLGKRARCGESIGSRGVKRKKKRGKIDD